MGSHVDTAAGTSSVDWTSIPLTDAHLEEFNERGFAIVENAYPEQLRTSLAAAIRRDLPSWEAVEHDPPTDRDELAAFARTLPNRTLEISFPYRQQIFNQFLVDPELLSFVRRALQSESIHFRFAHNWVRYPLVGVSPDPPRVHVDHGNNSLLPPNDDVRDGQVSTWYFPEAVGDDEAPMLLIPKEHGSDVKAGMRLVVPAGTLMIFHTQVWHSSTRFRAPTGQRYSITRIYGRADHYWEGVGLVTSFGQSKPFREFVGGLTAAERQVFRFPPPGHPYYTEDTLAVLEAQYPGWNARGEYAPGRSIAANDIPRLHSFELIE